MEKGLKGGRADARESSRSNQRGQGGGLEKGGKGRVAERMGSENSGKILETDAGRA